MREHFNSRGRTAHSGKKIKIKIKIKKEGKEKKNQPQKKPPKKPNHKSHLLILHKLPYKSSCLHPIPNDMSEQTLLSTGLMLMPVIKQTGICLLYPTRQITNTRLESF